MANIAEEYESLEEQVQLLRLSVRRALEKWSQSVSSEYVDRADLNAAMLHDLGAAEAIWAKYRSSASALRESKLPSTQPGEQKDVLFIAGLEDNDAVMKPVSSGKHAYTELVASLQKSHASEFVIEPSKWPKPWEDTKSLQVTCELRHLLKLTMTITCDTEQITHLQVGPCQIQEPPRDVHRAVTNECNTKLTALQSRLGGEPWQVFEQLLNWFISYKTLFVAPCEACGHYLSPDGLLLPPCVRTDDDTAAPKPFHTSCVA